MKKLLFNNKILMCLIFSIFCILILRPIDAKATDDLEGKLSISYSSGTGKLSAVYSGDQTLSGGEVYTWYKDGSTVSTGYTYTPSAAGSYYCILKDTNSYTGTLTSSSITLYKASGSNVTFDNSYGLYESGETVNVTATLSGSQSVTNWATSAVGVAIPQTGTTVSFRMPSQNLTVTPTIKSLYTIQVNGGTADSYEAYTGETVTIKASTISGKQFVSWSTTGGKLGDASQSTTTLTVANSNVVVTASFTGDTTTSTSTSTNSGVATATNAVYEVLNNGGHSVQVKHHSQGPLADAAFKYAQGYDWLVTDYFNITIDNSLKIYELPSPVQIRLTIPNDLIAANRNWRMVCVSRNGSIYSFADEDSNDSTITFSPDRFYAYAMCYNDIQPSTEEEIIVEDASAEISAEPIETTPTSTLHSVADSQTGASEIHSADSSVTSGTAGNSKIKSDQDSAVERADGATVSLINM